MHDATGNVLSQILGRHDGMTRDKLGSAQGNNLIGETTDTNYQSYIYEPGTFKPLALLKGEGKAATPYYYHLDQIGTPTEITDVAGQSVWAVQYRAYGSVLTQQVEEIQSPLRFQGQYYDAETGLHYNRHRYYSPDTGRFTTADPIGLAGGLNNYQYAPNPTGWVDPLGLAKKECNDPNGKDSGNNPEPEMPQVKYRALTESQAQEALAGCSGQLKLATVSEFFQYSRSDSLGVSPPLY
ncbi:RHS repeat-associated core domain-containing protein [Vibrio rhizosphaerae]|uniref:RHS repeat-associated core domain-containing protein n=1 Tax=Vibrio rhizosphaerae TaxID=398736 RepID=A0ABU4IUE1_9VIBR|nr:RHS repeat-associated core domain-containing protein [Vibrio rhizosphaerae]MDW6093009.1 RHS repeat-associated core domain-containing protein [Vibrio rhizosphaerae]